MCFLKIVLLDLCVYFEGMMARGKYTMKSSIFDDDKNTYAKWEWTLEIAKEWK